MPQASFYGRIASDDVGVVRELLRAWLDTSRLDEKLKLSGEQLVYESDDVYVYAHAADGAAQFLLEGHRKSGVDETRSWLQELFERCAASGVAATLEYVAVDDAGQEIGEQYTLS